MLDVCLLGTGGMMPLPGRYLTSLLVRYNGSCLLIDCGEGTQIALKEAGWTFKPIDTICFTHYHADHISGLPGILLAMANADRTEPLTLIGPKGSVTIEEGVICAKRHIHLRPCDAEEFGVENGQIVSVKLDAGRPLVYGDVVVRVSESFMPAMHIDVDECNAAGVSGELYGEIIK